MGFKKVLLIHPDYPGGFCTIPNWPLGLGYIAQSLRTVGVEYQVVDLRFGYASKFLYKKIAEFCPDMIGLSLMTSKYRHHYAFIKALKETFSEIPIVVYF